MRKGIQIHDLLNIDSQLKKIDVQLLSISKNSIDNEHLFLLCLKEYENGECDYIVYIYHTKDNYLLICERSSEIAIAQEKFESMFIV